MTTTKIKSLVWTTAAILSSTFAEILFLDFDSYLVRDPEYLFLSDPMYDHFGALFFPNLPTSPQPKAIWQLLNLTCARNEHESDSGILLIDKRRTWNALQMAKSMADDHELVTHLVRLFEEQQISHWMIFFSSSPMVLRIYFD